MKAYYVYMLLCRDGKYYTGVTNNLEARVRQHQDGIDPNSFTYKRRPVKLVYSTMFNEVNAASAFEKQLKGWSRAKKEAIINGEWNILPELSKNRMDPE